MSSPLSGFTAVPNPYMVPLLFYQSVLIGAGFGIGYQGMRRKLSAMPNEEFNKLDLGTFAFDQFKSITAASHFDKALNMMHPIMDKLAAAFGQMINKLPENFTSFFRGVTEGPPPVRETSTSASNVFYGGSIGIPAGLLKGVQPVISQADIDKLAKDYMDATGITDFEQAKEKIRLAIIAKNKLVNAPRVAIPVPHYVPLSQRTPTQSTSSAFQIEINSNIANLRSNIRELESQIRQNNVTMRTVTGTRRSRLQTENRQLVTRLLARKRLLLDWIKKGQNLQTLLRNR